jgi:membrane-associated protein
MFDITSLVQSAGYIGLFAIIFAESGLLIGFFLPGDSLIFTAGFLASQGHLNIYVLAPLLFFAAVIGDSVGYSLGYRLGPKIFKREDSLFFHKDNVLKAQNFFEKHVR